MDALKYKRKKGREGGKKEGGNKSKGKGGGEGRREYGREIRGVGKEKEKKR